MVVNGSGHGLTSPPLNGSNLYKPIGVSGLDRLYGFVRDEFVKELQGENFKRVVKEMSENDPTCGAVLYAIEMLVRNTKWVMNPASDDLESLRWCDWFKSTLFNDMTYSIEDTLAEIMSFLEWGWSYMEITYKPRNGDNPKTIPGNGGIPMRLPLSNFDDNMIGWSKWEIRSQDTLYAWDYDENDSFKGMIQQAPPTYTRTLIPIEKSLHFKATSRKGSPEGKSILRRAYLSWYYKKNIQRIEAIGIERDLAGLPVFWAPPELFQPNLSPEQQAVKTSIMQLVTNVRRDASEGVIVPLAYNKDGKETYRFELMGSGGSRQFDTSGIVQRYDQSIAMTMLADFIFLGHTAVGSWALASSKTNLFAQSLGAYLDMIQQVLNQFAIPRLAKLNGIPKEYWPALEHGDVESVDLADLGGFISQLSGAGFDLTQFPRLLPHLLEQAHLPIAGYEETQAELDHEPTDDELDQLNAEEDRSIEQTAVQRRLELQQARIAASESGLDMDEVLDEMCRVRDQIRMTFAEEHPDEVFAW